MTKLQDLHLKLIKEVSAHGVSIIEIQKGSSEFSINKSSLFFNKRIAKQQMNINGPVKSRFS